MAQSNTNINIYIYIYTHMCISTGTFEMFFSCFGPFQVWGVIDFLRLFSVVYVVFYVEKCYMLYVHNIFPTFSQ